MGGADHFFRQLWQRGTDRPDAMYESWHWPSSISPLVDERLLEEIRGRETSEYFNREYLAEWTDASGMFFSEQEISDAIGDYPMLDLDSVRAQMPWNHEAKARDQIFSACAGVDWGFSQDAQAIVLVSALDDGGLNDGDDLCYFVPYLEYRFGCSYSAWIDRITELAGSWHLPVIASETNGVGAYPTEDLRMRLQKAWTRSMVVPVWTDARRKQSMFGKVKTLLQRGQLALPRSEPELLKQLRALEFEQLQGGSMRIAVPERAGHDDLALSLGQSVSCLRPWPAHGGRDPGQAVHAAHHHGIRHEGAAAGAAGRVPPVLVQASERTGTWNRPRLVTAWSCPGAWLARSPSWPRSGSTCSGNGTAACFSTGAGLADR